LDHASATVHSAARRPASAEKPRGQLGQLPAPLPGRFAKSPLQIFVINPPSKAVQNNKKYVPAFSVLAPVF